ncbi:MAG: hypothetical protein DDT31_00650 [Syntrophomonadaceae bacterium]|nr:hypothetical protein [Bacillota bacterium]
MSDTILGENLIIDLAFRDAAVATKKYLEDHPDQWYPCGFSWVRIRPARGKLVSILKDRGFGARDTYEGGFVVHNPSGNFTQCMGAKEAGSRAFVETIKKAYPNLEIYAETRVD